MASLPGRPTTVDSPRTATKPSASTTSIFDSLGRNRLIGIVVAVVAVVGLSYYVFGGSGDAQKKPKKNKGAIALCQKLDCNAEQKEAIPALILSYRADNKSDQKEIKKHWKTISKNFSGEDIDPAEVNEANEAVREVQARVDERASKTLAEIHPLLDEDQRKALGKLVARLGPAKVLAPDRRGRLSAEEPQSKGKGKKGKKKKGKKKKGKKGKKGKKDKGEKSIGIPTPRPPMNPGTRSERSFGGAVARDEAPPEKADPPPERREAPEERERPRG